MPDYPEAAVTAAADDLTAWMIKHGWMPGLPPGQVREVCASATTRVLDSAAPILVAEVARKILAHAEEHWPDGRQAGKVPRRQLQVAAQVASRAFSTREDELREIAAALVRGDYLARDIPEGGAPHDV